MDSLALPAEIPEGATYPSQLKKLAEEKPEKPAYVLFDKDWNKTVLTRMDIWDKGRKFAAILKRHGVNHGDIVCNTLVNSPERLLTTFGTLLAGAAVMHGQIFLADGEDFLFNLKTSKCKIVLIDPGHSMGASTIMDRIKYIDEATEEVRYSGLPHLTTVLSVNACGPNECSGKWINTLDQEQEFFEETRVCPDDTAFIFNTSGTTGFSKLVPHTHKTSLYIASYASTLIGAITSEAVVYNDRSMGWIGGFPASYLMSGCTRVARNHANGMPENVAAHTIRMMNEEKVDCGIIIPVEIDQLLQCINDGERLNQQLRVFGTGGVPLTSRILAGLGTLTNSIVAIYGASEMGLAACLPITENTSFKDYCVGRFLEGVEMKLVNEQGEEVKTGETGEIIIRSPTLTSGYLNSPEKTQKSFTEDGSFFTGDMAYMDDEGLLYVFCRKANAIMRGAFIHYPGWLEARIQKCPGVQKVNVIGVPDPVLHEEVCACVVQSQDQTLTEEALDEYCKNLFVASENSEINPIPKYFLFFDKIPTNNNGKVDRMSLRAEACKRLNIEQK